MFEIVETDPKLPITLKDGEEVTVKIILRVPQEGYKGNLKITIYA
jgi:predicted DNA-binding antitoxin AbrB/MazE fold protein